MTEHSRKFLGIVTGKGLERIGHSPNSGVLIPKDDVDSYGETGSAEEMPVDHRSSFGGARRVLYVNRRDGQYRTENGVIDYGKIIGILTDSGVTDILSTSTVMSYSPEIPEGRLVLPVSCFLDHENVEFDPELRRRLYEAGDGALLNVGTYASPTKTAQESLDHRKIIVGATAVREYGLARKSRFRYACLAIVTRNRPNRNASSRPEIRRLKARAAEILKKFADEF